MSVPEDRPLVETDHHTEDLPATPQRDRTIPAERWIEAPPELRALGADIGEPVVVYKRRIGGWLLWRGGAPPQGAPPPTGPRAARPPPRAPPPALPPRRRSAGRGGG